MAKITDIAQAPLVFFDLEMTGLSPSVHEIAEIGAVRAVRDGDGWKATEKRNWLVAPEHMETADSEALATFGYTKEEWEGAVPARIALSEFMAFAQGAYLVGHNSAVDWSFLSLALHRAGIENMADYHILDTASLSYLLSEGKESVSLGDVAVRYGIGCERAHRASDDALTTFRIFESMWRQLRGKHAS